MPDKFTTLISCTSHVNFWWKWNCPVGLYNLRSIRVWRACILDLPHERSLRPNPLEVIYYCEPYFVSFVDSTRVHEQRVRKKDLRR